MRSLIAIELYIQYFRTTNLKFAIPSVPGILHQLKRISTHFFTVLKRKLVRTAFPFKNVLDSRGPLSRPGIARVAHSGCVLLAAVIVALDPAILVSKFVHKQASIAIAQRYSATKRDA